MPPPRWEDEDEDPTPYGLSRSDALISGVDADLGRIRISNQPVQVKCLAIADR